MSDMPLGEHQVPNSKAVTSADIPQKEQLLVKQVKELFGRFKNHNQPYKKRFLDFYKFFRGDQWHKMRPKHMHSEIVNMVWQAIQASFPMQTDVRPRFEFIPQEPGDREFADILDQVAISDWEREDWLRELSAVILDGYIYGTGFSSMHYDPEKNYGIGGAVYESEDPFHCYPDIDARDINHPDSKAFIKAYPCNTMLLKRKYPDKAKFIKSDVVDFERQEKTNINQHYIRPTKTDRNMPAEQEAGKSEDLASSQKSFVIEAYLKPHDLEESKETRDEEGGEPKEIYVLRKKYPNGRKIVVACGVVLEDGPLPYEDGLFPFSKYNNYILPREFYGVSEVEQLESPQRVFNKILSFTLDILTLTGNPQWIVSKNAGIDTGNLTNRPGGILEPNPGADVRRIDGSNLNPAFMQVLNQLQGWFNDVAGLSEVQQGNVPGSVTAASAIEQLTDNSRTRIKQKMRNMDEYLRDAGRQYRNRVMQFYAVPKVFTYTGEDGAQQYFKMSIEPVKDDDGNEFKKARVSRFTSIGETADLDDDVKNSKPVLREEDTKEYIIKGDFDCRVNTGSSLPFTIADKERRSLALFDRGLIDAEQVLDDLQHPNKEKLLERIKEQQAIAAQQEQQQGGTNA